MSGLNIAVLPISGPMFAAQIGIGIELTSCGWDPSIMLTASGGGIAGHIFNASDCNPNKIFETSGLLSSDLFCRKWFPYGSFYGYYHGYTKEGCLFNSGRGVSELLRSVYSPDLIGKREIWSLTYNDTRKKAQLFCNRSSSQIRGINVVPEQDIYQIDKHYYCDEDIDLIAKVVIASASVPGLVPPQIIDDCSYQDGGLSCASPMSLMADVFNQYEKLHITYVNCSDINEETQGKPIIKTLPMEMNEARKTVLRHVTIHDRAACYNLINRPTKECFDLTEENYRYVQHVQKSKKRTLLEVYTTETTGVNIVNFTGSDLQNYLLKNKGSYLCRFWH